MTKLIAYDLASENRRLLENQELKEKVRNARISATQALHKLGVQTTESVIIVPSSNENRIEQTKLHVYNLFNQVQRFCLERNLTIDLWPTIEVIDLTPTQTEQYTRLAKVNLAHRIDEAIDRVSRFMESLEQLTNARQIRQAKYNVARQKETWQEIFQIAQDLGIDLGQDYEYLISLLDNAAQRLR
jgi:hypothetical protein